MARLFVIRRYQPAITNVHYEIASVINRHSPHQIFITPDEEPVCIIDPESNWSDDISPIHFHQRLYSDISYQNRFVNELNNIVAEHVKPNSVGNLTFSFDDYYVRIYSIMNGISAD